MAATTDYDAPRRGTIEHAETESLDANKTARADTQSPDVDLDGSGGPTRHPDRAAHGTEPE